MRRNAALGLMISGIIDQDQGMFKPIAAYFMLLSLALPAIALAAETQYNNNSQIKLSRIPLANVHFQARQDGKRYTIDAQATTTAIADMVAPSKAEMSSKGIVRNGKWEPANYSFRYKSGKRSRSFD